MLNSEPISVWKKLGIGLLLGGGLVCVANLGVNGIRSFQRPRGVTSEEIAESFRKSDAIDRANWEKMWKEAGKMAPPLPKSHSVSHNELNGPVGQD